MSHRATFAVREHGRVRLSTSRQGGTAVPDLLLEGPASARAVLADEAAVAPEDVHGYAACEGLILLDDDERVVLFDGVSELMYEGAMRRAWLPVLHRLWRGWRLFHTPDPLRHLGEHLAFSEAWLAAKASGVRTLRSDPTPLGTHAPEWIENHQTEVQWREADGDWHGAVIDVKPLNVLARGPALSGLMPETPAVPPVDREVPWGLLRADARERRLYVWTDLPVYRLAPEAEAVWPGWTVSLLTLPEAARLSRSRFTPTAEETERAVAFMRGRLPGVSW